MNFIADKKIKTYTSLVLDFWTLGFLFSLYDIYTWVYAYRFHCSLLHFNSMSCCVLFLALYLSSTDFPWNFSTVLLAWNWINLDLKIKIASTWALPLLYFIMHAKVQNLFLLSWTWIPSFLCFRVVQKVRGTLFAFQRIPFS